MVILREIQAEGYPGGMTILRQYIGPKRALWVSRFCLDSQFKGSAEERSEFNKGGRD